MSHSKRATTMSNDHESRIIRLEVIIENINNTLINLNNRMDRIENKLDKIDARTWQLMLFMVGGFSTLLGVMAHGFHWL